MQELKMLKLLKEYAAIISVGKFQRFIQRIKLLPS